MKRRPLLLAAGLAAVVPAHAATATGWVGDPIFHTPIFEPTHPAQPQRVDVIEAALQSSPLAAKVVPIKAAAGNDAALRLIYTDPHIESIRAQHGARIDAVARTAAGATIAAIDAIDAVAARRVRNAFVCSRPPGHHARNSGREEGFCFYNHVAIGARHAQRRHGWARVLIVDWDYHHGDGTESFFYDDPSVLVFSTHGVKAYPGTGLASRHGSGAGEGFNINVPLSCGASDDDVAAAFEQKLVPAATRFRPELVMISAGFDSRAGDRLGCFALSDEGFARLTRIVMKIADAHCGGRIVSVLEGGDQGAGLASAALAHVDALTR